MFKQFDTIKTLQALPEVAIPAGTVGTILDVYDHPYPAYEVEFADENGVTIAMLALTKDQISLVEKFNAKA